MGSNTVLFTGATHKNVLLEDFSSGGFAVQANQHVIVDGNQGMVLDPGGHKVYSRVLGAALTELGRSQLKWIFLSHQDPDIVAASNGWLMTTDADAWISALWTRFVPHFGLDHLVEKRLHPIPDSGMVLELGATKLLVIPAHFLHSPGNFQIYDPTSKILYSGDLGASVGVNYIEVGDFDEHLKYMEGFHKRYMTSNRSMRAWVKMVRQLEIDIIAPQHGALFRGKEKCKRFIDWCESLQCGVDVMDDVYRIPS
jgi:flavorubredoxin